MGCFCCSLASFWQILFFTHSAACTVPRLASAGLSWEIQFFSLERGRGFSERAKLLGQGDLSSLHFNLGWQQKSGTLHPQKSRLHCYVVLHTVVLAHSRWEQRWFSGSRTWASPFILLALPLSCSMQSAVIVWGNLRKGWSARGHGAVGIGLCVPGGADAVLLQPVKICPWKIDVWNTSYAPTFPRHTS